MPPSSQNGSFELQLCNRRESLKLVPLRIVGTAGGNPAVELVEEPPTTAAAEWQHGFDYYCSLPLFSRVQRGLISPLYRPFTAISPAHARKISQYLFKALRLRAGVVREQIHAKKLQGRWFVGSDGHWLPSPAIGAAAPLPSGSSPARLHRLSSNACAPPQG